MADKAILLVHGMGTHKGAQDGEKGSFQKEFEEATSEILQKFNGHENDTLASHIDIHEYNYDDWFDEMRKIMSEKANSMTDRLNSVGETYGVTVPLDLAGKLLSFETKFANDDFFYTHWLDVIFYATMLGEKVRVNAGKKVAEMVKKYGPGNVHLVAHSLGTAVMHDTLHKLYRPESDPSDEIPDLSPVDNRLASIWMIANVSRLVDSVTQLANTYNSVVKPGNGGCTGSFTNIRHVLDPFTWLAQFDPSDNGKWVSHDVFSKFYENIATRLVVDGNTHSIKQYLQDPEVVRRMLPRFHPDFKPSLDEFDSIKEKYEEMSIQGAYAALEEHFRNLKKGDDFSWKDFLESAKELKEISDRIKEQLT